MKDAEQYGYMLMASYKRGALKDVMDSQMKDYFMESMQQPAPPPYQHTPQITVPTEPLLDRVERLDQERREMQQIAAANNEIRMLGPNIRMANIEGSAPNLAISANSIAQKQPSRKRIGSILKRQAKRLAQGLASAADVIFNENTEAMFSSLANNNVNRPAIESARVKRMALTNPLTGRPMSVEDVD